MSATTTPTDFVDLYTDVLNRVRGDTTRTTDLNLAKRYINTGLHDLHIQQNWPWAERRSAINTRTKYTTGSVSFQAGVRATAIGNNTAWNTTIADPFSHVPIRAGGKLLIGGDTASLEVSSVVSDTQLSLVTRYLENITSASAYVLAYGSYTYFEDEYALASDFGRLVDLRSFSDNMPIEVISRQDFYRRYPRNNASFNTPRVCTIIDLAPSGSVATQPRVLFYPAPDTYYAIPYRYITTTLATSSAGAAQTNLSADADEPVIPLRYRHVLIFFAIAQWYRDRKDDTRSQEANADYVDLVKRMANDSNPERDNPRLKGARSRYLQRTAGPLRRPSGSRFTTGTAWDELRE